MQDVAWNRRGTCFCVVAGHMPAKAQLFNQRCKLVADLGSGSFNIVRWSPQVTIYWVWRHDVLAGMANDALVSMQSSSGGCAGWPGSALQKLKSMHPNDAFMFLFQWTAACVCPVPCLI